ncbi:MAG: DUF4258 domain-containing protein [Nitrospiria bacterium]
MTESEDLLQKIRLQVDTENVRITLHAQQEMVEEYFKFDEVLEALRNGQILENYPEHRRGACCLIGGFTKKGRPIHIVCTTGQQVLILITIYEPKPPKWITPTQRRR